MIFVTVGTGEFDKLVESVDNAKKSGAIRENIVMQIGEGIYTPKNCEYFKFKPNLEEEYKKAKIIIAHGGAGTTFELLKKRKRIVSAANYSRTDSHQEDILRALSEAGYLIWCKDLNKIGECLEKAKKAKLKKYVPPNCKIAKIASEFIDKI